MDSLIAKNENVRAVGNMHVNAKGDVVDSSNKVTSTRSEQVNKNYRKQHGNVAVDVPFATSKQDLIDEPIVGLDEEQVVEPAPAPAPKPKAKTRKTKKASTAKGGLAGAIAKTQE
jgi:hypothetical protein